MCINQSSTSTIRSRHNSTDSSLDVRSPTPPTILEQRIDDRTTQRRRLQPPPPPPRRMDTKLTTVAQRQIMPSAGPHAAPRKRPQVAPNSNVVSFSGTSPIAYEYRQSQSSDESTMYPTPPPPIASSDLERNYAVQTPPRPILKNRISRNANEQEGNVEIDTSDITVLARNGNRWYFDV
jgi:hypothetical protein